MTTAVDLWNDFVERGLSDSAALLDGVTQLIGEERGREAIPEMAYISFSLAAQALLLGAEELGRLTSAVERCLAHLLDGQVDPGQALPILASSIDTIGRAFAELAAADESGARIEDTPLAAVTYEIETLLPLPGASAKPLKTGPDVLLSQLGKRPGAAATPPVLELVPAQPPQLDSAAEDRAAPAGTTIWQPEVDEDMVELFFEEVSDRIEALSVKLLEIEQRPDDLELLRDVFRDWHTIKGSAAMVNLVPMTRLAHAAEDLVGQLREGKRSATGPVIDALLASLDVLREIANQAQHGGVINVAHDSLYERLKQPEVAVAAEPVTPAPEGTQAVNTTASTGLSVSARQTIRVDFDKLDSLMNLVGELVLGRDGLGDAIAALSALSGEVTSGHELSRQVGKMLEARAVDSEQRGELLLLGEELSRVERVLVDIFQDLDTSSDRLDSISADLRDSVMSLRMVPVGNTLRKHHRTVRDLANSLGKSVRLELKGEDTELDKVLVEALDEPLMHLIRNAVDHGIESPAERLAAGKSAEGTVKLSATHKGNQVVIEIADDGSGIDVAKVKARAAERQLVSPDVLGTMTSKEAMELIFAPGFSTAEVVSEVSGRGVGMDVVRQTIISRLKGSIDISSRLGKGSVFTLRLPLTLAIAQVLLGRAGGEIFAIPLDSVTRTIVVPASEVQLIQDREVIAVNGQQVPLIRVNRVLELDSQHDELARELSVVLCEHADNLYGLVVEALLEKREIVIKSLGDILQEVPCTGGATLIGDHCAIILDVAAVIRRAVQGASGAAAPRPERESQTRAAISAEQASRPGARSILLVEDSDVVRETLRRLLTEAGYRVVVARDGVEGLAISRTERFDLVSTDVMMPRMDGYELTRELRKSASYRDTPIVMVTSRGERIDRVRGFDAGVDEYITKPHDRHLLLRAVKKLLGDA